MFYHLCLTQITHNSKRHFDASIPLSIVNFVEYMHVFHQYIFQKSERMIVLSKKEKCVVNITLIKNDGIPQDFRKSRRISDSSLILQYPPR